jgi:hypothetical protein
MTTSTDVQDDARRRAPVTVEWKNEQTAHLKIGDALWSEVEWSEKRQAWCVQDAEGRCFKHIDRIHATTSDKAEAITLAEAMIRDGRMPTPEDAKAALGERLQRDREKRAKQPAETERRERRAEEGRLLDQSLRLKFEEQGLPPYYELIADVFDLADPELWKRNSFARLREKLILSLKREIARIEAEQLGDLRRHGKRRTEKHSVRHQQSSARLARAKELLALIQVASSEARP